MQRAFRKDDGAVATEYAFLVVFIAIAGAFGVAILGDNLALFFHDIGTSITSTVSDVMTAAAGLFEDDSCGNQGGGDGTGGDGGSGQGGDNTC